MDSMFYSPLLFQGTVWYSIFKWPIVANLTSSLGYTASSLGNHELDDGVVDLVAYMRATRNAYPTLSCNLELENEPGKWMQVHRYFIRPYGCTKSSHLQTDLDRELQCSVVVEVGGQKIGIMGYLTPETKVRHATSRREYPLCPRKGLDELGVNARAALDARTRNLSKRFLRHRVQVSAKVQILGFVSSPTWLRCRATLESSFC